MRFGDLSNRSAPRVIILFEGVIGTLPPENVVAYDKAIKREDWRKAISQFILRQDYVNKVFYLSHNKDVSITIWTTLSPEAAEVIEDRFDNLSIPVRGCFFMSPDELGRDLSYNPDVVCVYSHVPEHVLTFGSKGYVVKEAADLGRML